MPPEAFNLCISLINPETDYNLLREKAPSPGVTMPHATRDTYPNFNLNPNLTDCKINHLTGAGDADAPCAKEEEDRN